MQICSHLLKTSLKKNIALYGVGFLIAILELRQVVFQSFLTPARFDNLGRCTPQFISLVQAGIYIIDLLYFIITSFLLHSWEIYYKYLFAADVFIQLSCDFPYDIILETGAYSYMLSTIAVWMRAFFHRLITKIVQKWKIEVFFWQHIFSFKMGPSLESLCHKKRLDKYIFTHPHTHLKRQTAVLRNGHGHRSCPFLQCNIKLNRY